jgi:hypothetical protein
LHLAAFATNFGDTKLDNFGECYRILQRVDGPPTFLGEITKPLPRPEKTPDERMGRVGLIAMDGVPHSEAAKQLSGST